MLSRMLGGLLSPAGSRGSLSILLFHRVSAKPDPLFPELPDATRFDDILRWVGRAFNVLPLERAIDSLRAGRLPARALAITFDDGYEDNCSVAAPILMRHRMSATFFIASDFLDGGRMWNDTVIAAVRGFAEETLDLSRLALGKFKTATIAQKRDAIDRLLPALKYLSLDERLDKATQIAGVCGTALPDDLMMTSSQLLTLRSAGMEIGGHTRRHPILAVMDEREASEEIAGGKARLESILGERISLFAYPNGEPGRDYLEAHVRMVKDAGFSAAVSTSPGVARVGADTFQLPRFTPWDRSELRFGLRLVDNMRFAATSTAT